MLKFVSQLFIKYVVKLYHYLVVVKKTIYVHLEALITVHILNAYIFFIYEYFLTKLSASAIDSISNNIIE